MAKQQFHPSALTAVYEYPVNLNDDNTTYAKIVGAVEAGQRVLEVGCSTGFMSKYLKDKGCHVTGVEINPAAAVKAKTICDRVLVGSIEDEQIRRELDSAYDLIIMADVLEHLADPAKTLTCLTEFMAERGRMLISVPNIAHWSARRELLLGRFEYRDLGLMDKTHLRFFTLDSFRRTARACGLRVTRLEIIANYNTLGDITFKTLERLYRHKRARNFLINKVEKRLARWLPRLFAYQFVFTLEKAS